MKQLTHTAISYCFAVVDKSYKLLLDPEQKKRAVDVIQAGKEYVEHMVSGICQLTCRHIPSVPFLHLFHNILSLTGKAEKKATKERWETAGCGGGRP